MLVCLQLPQLLAPELSLEQQARQQQQPAICAASSHVTSVCHLAAGDAVAPVARTLTLCECRHLSMFNALPLLSTRKHSSKHPCCKWHSTTLRKGDGRHRQGQGRAEQHEPSNANQCWVRLLTQLRNHMLLPVCTRWWPCMQ